MALVKEKFCGYICIILFRGEKMSKDKGSFIKRPVLVAGIFITVVLVVAFISVFWSESERNASFLNSPETLYQSFVVWGQPCR